MWTQAQSESFSMNHRISNLVGKYIINILCSEYVWGERNHFEVININARNPFRVDSGIMWGSQGFSTLGDQWPLFIQCLWIYIHVTIPCYTLAWLFQLPLLSLVLTWLSSSWGTFEPLSLLYNCYCYQQKNSLTAYEGLALT